MNIITRYRILQWQGVIRNLHRCPEFNIETELDGLDRKVTYTFNNQPFLVLRFHYNSEEIGLEYLDSQLCIESGLCIEEPSNWECITDALYYKCNPFKYGIAGKPVGQQLDFVMKLQTRIEKRAFSGSNFFTNDLIDHVFSTLALENGVRLTTSESTLEEIKTYLEAIGNIPMLRTLSWRCRFDVARNKWVDNTCAREVSTRETTLYISKKLNKDIFMNQRFGYNPIPSTGMISYSYSLYYNPITETVIENSIYLRTEVVEVICDSCGVVHHQFESSEGICSTCIASLGKIHSYSTKAPQLLKFKANKVKTNTLYLGAELEFESTSSADKSKDAIFTNRVLKNHAILKSDGSINQGFEIVTCPATLEIHLAEFKQFFGEFKEKTKLHKDSNTGMHVHISRKPLSMLTVGKMTAFLNAEGNKEFITKIAGRDFNHYCRQDSSRTVSFPLTVGSGERYNSLNLNNTDTVELRIFSTPETFDEFAYKMEFSEALAIYCSPCTVNMSVYKLLEHSNFKDWVMNQKHSYPHLVTKLKSL